LRDNTMKACMQDQWSWYKAGSPKRKLDVWSLICSLRNTGDWCARLWYHEPF